MIARTTTPETMGFHGLDTKDSGHGIYCTAEKEILDSRSKTPDVRVSVLMLGIDHATVVVSGLVQGIPHSRRERPMAIACHQHTVVASEINPSQRKAALREQQRRHGFIRTKIEEQRQRLAASLSETNDRLARDLRSLDARPGMDDQRKSLEHRRLELKAEESILQARGGVEQEIRRLEIQLKEPLDVYEIPGEDLRYEVEICDERIRHDAWVDVHVLTPRGETGLETYHGAFFYGEGTIHLAFEYFVPVRQPDGADDGQMPTNLVAVKLPSPEWMELAIYVGQVGAAT
jgi:hypothetical protein